MKDVSSVEDILKIFPVSIEACYGTNSKRNDDDAKTENAIRSSPCCGCREGSPAANQRTKSCRNRMPVVKEPRPNTSEPYTPPSPAPVQSGPGGSIDFHREVKFGEEERKAPAQENFYETDDMDQNRAHRSLGLLSMRLDVQPFGSAVRQ